MFGLQKQRRNAAGGGAWFIAGHLTVFAKLSHHAVPLESRIFSSRCFSSSVPPPSCPTLPSPLPWFCRLLSLSLSLAPIYLPSRVTTQRRRPPRSFPRRISLATSLPAEDTSGFSNFIRDTRLSKRRPNYFVWNYPYSGRARDVNYVFSDKEPISSVILIFPSWSHWRFRNIHFTLPSFSPKSNAKFERDHMSRLRKRLVSISDLRAIHETKIVLQKFIHMLWQLPRCLWEKEKSRVTRPSCNAGFAGKYFF